MLSSQFAENVLDARAKAREINEEKIVKGQRQKSRKLAKFRVYEEVLEANPDLDETLDKFVESTSRAKGRRRTLAKTVGKILESLPLSSSDSDSMDEGDVSD